MSSVDGAGSGNFQLTKGPSNESGSQPNPSSGFRAFQFSTPGGFGASTAPSGFRGPTTPGGFGGSIAPSGFGGVSTTPSGFGSASTTPGGFGGSTATPSGFGSTSITTPSAFGGSTATPSGFKSTSTTPSAFGGSTATMPSAFGSSTTLNALGSTSVNSSTPSGFSNTFSQPPNPTSSNLTFVSPNSNDTRPALVPQSSQSSDFGKTQGPAMFNPSSNQSQENGQISTSTFNASKENISSTNKPASQNPPSMFSQQPSTTFKPPSANTTQLGQRPKVTASATATASKSNFFLTSSQSNPMTNATTPSTTTESSNSTTATTTSNAINSNNASGSLKTAGTDSASSSKLPGFSSIPKPEPINSSSTDSLATPNQSTITSTKLLQPISTNSVPLPVSLHPVRTDVLSSLKNKTLDDIISDWTKQIEIDKDTFTKQALLVSAWDTKVNENGEKIIQLKQNVDQIYAAQSELQQNLELIASQQTELKSLLTTLEEQAEQWSLAQDLSPTDRQREKGYKLAGDINVQLDQMSIKLKELVNRLNSAQERELDNDNPLFQIVQILNSHLSSLQWIDQTSSALNSKLLKLNKS